MKKSFLIFGLLLIKNIFCTDFTHINYSEHFQILCTDKDLELHTELVEECEKMYDRLSIEFQHQINKSIQVQIFPDIVSFHKAIHKENAPDWLICNLQLPIQIVSPLNPGPYHSSENIKKALLKGVVQTFIYDKYKSCNAPWWLIAGVTSKKVGWPYITLPSSLPDITVLEASDYGDPGMGWCAVSLTSFIEEKYGWDAILKLLEDYNTFEEVISLTKEKVVAEWQSSIGNKWRG